MISRNVIKGITSVARLCVPAASLLRNLHFGFARVSKMSPFKRIVDVKIKEEQKNTIDLTSYLNDFAKEGWSVNQQGIIVELTKKVGSYDVIILSNVRSHANLEDGEGEKKSEKSEGEQGESLNAPSQITIIATKAGNPKTLVVSTVVTQGFEIVSIHFTTNIQAAKKHHSDIIEPNSYSGPEITTLSNELLEKMYEFLETDLEIKEELLSSLINYCLQYEQKFYINWLKDMKAIY